MAALTETGMEFTMESARREAVDASLDQRMFTLESDHYDEFVEALNAPPAPGPKLSALLRRVPIWQTYTDRRED